MFKWKKSVKLKFKNPPKLNFDQAEYYVILKDICNRFILVELLWWCLEVCFEEVDTLVITNKDKSTTNGAQHICEVTLKRERYLYQRLPGNNSYLSHRIMNSFQRILRYIIIRLKPILLAPRCRRHGLKPPFKKLGRPCTIGTFSGLSRFFLYSL